MTRTLLAAALGGVGFVLILLGVGMIFVPLVPIVAGLALVTFALFMEV